MLNWKFARKTLNHLKLYIKVLKKTLNSNLIEQIFKFWNFTKKLYIEIYIVMHLNSISIIIS